MTIRSTLYMYLYKNDGAMHNYGKVVFVILLLLCFYTATLGSTFMLYIYMYYNMYICTCSTHCLIYSYYGMRPIFGLLMSHCVKNLLYIVHSNNVITDSNITCCNKALSLQLGKLFVKYNVHCRVWFGVNCTWIK